VLAAEHLARLGGLDVGLVLVEPAGEIPVDGFAGLGPLDEDGDVVGPPLQGVAEGQLFFEASPALEQPLRLALVLPEVGFGDAGFYLVEFRTVSWGVKDSSGGRRCASPGPCSV